MKSKEVQAKTGLTRKAIIYYEAQGLVVPTKDENGHRNYSDEDISILTQINLYRKLGLSIFEIKQILRSDNRKETISNIVRDREIRHKIDAKRLILLNELADSNFSADVVENILSLEAQESIYNRLSNKFPGYFGQMFFVHYWQFLQGKLETTEQKQAFDDFVIFLDQMDELPLTELEEQYIQEGSTKISLDMMQSLADTTMQAVQDPQKWLKENLELMKTYLSIKESAEYHSTPAYIIQEKMRTYLQESGYYDIAIPLLRKMSPSYNEYYLKLIEADRSFLDQIKGSTDF